MALSLVTAPIEYPISVDDLKVHSRIVEDDEDTLLESLISAATTYCEKLTDNRQFVTATWDWTFRHFPRGRRFSLPKAPLQSVTSITYLDTAGASQTLATSVYGVLTDYSQPGCIYLKDSQTWPTVDDADNAIVVRFVAGYGAASDVPDSIQHAIRLLAGHWVENRETVSMGTTATSVPFAVQALLGCESVGSYV